MLMSVPHLYHHCLAQWVMTWVSPLTGQSCESMAVTRLVEHKHRHRRRNEKRTSKGAAHPLMFVKAT